MPTSIDPQPADDELECARCGAYFPIGLSRCPNCGVNIFDPEDEFALDDPIPHAPRISARVGLLARLRAFSRRILGKEDLAQALFSASIQQAELYDQLLRRVRNDREAADRLIAYEGVRFPQATHTECVQRAIERLEADNR